MKNRVTRMTINGLDVCEEAWVEIEMTTIPTPTEPAVPSEPVPHFSLGSVTFAVEIVSYCLPVALMPREARHEKN